MNKKVKYKDANEKYKLLYKLEKKRSPIIIEFRQDDFLISIIKYARKSKKVNESFSILNSEIDDWLETYKEYGYKINM